MVIPKTSMLTLGIESALKVVLPMAADREHYLIANMVEVLFRHYGRRKGIAIPEHSSLSGDGDLKGKK